MENVKIIADFFLVSLAWSFILFSPIASSKLTGNGFIKLISNLATGSLVISVIVSLLSHVAVNSPFFYLKVIALISLVLTSLFHRDEKSTLMWVLYAIIVSTLGFDLYLFSPQVSNSLFLISSSLLLGIITYAMVLGHWYLVVPKLSEKPLLVAALITWGILALKIIFSTLSIYKHFDFFESQTTLGAGYAFNWLLLSMRVSFGYLVILGMSIFNWKLVRIRSIQSSTGILYAMTFFIFVGELISTYLFFNYGLHI
jgi:hypothetical protein